MTWLVKIVFLHTLVEQKRWFFFSRITTHWKQFSNRVLHDATWWHVVISTEYKFMVFYFKFIHNVYLLKLVKTNVCAPFFWFYHTHHETNIDRGYSTICEMPLFNNIIIHGFTHFVLFFYPFCFVFFFRLFPLFLFCFRLMRSWTRIWHQE